MPKSRTQANAVAPAEYQCPPWRSGYARAPTDAAVVEIVRVAVPAALPVMLTGLLEPKLKAGGFWAPAGLEVIDAISVTLPVKPPAGVTVMVEVFPVVAPGITVTPTPLTAKLGGTFTTRLCVICGAAL
jgi:hypothetical protein